MIFLQEKRETSPLVEGRVCAEWQKTLPPKPFSVAAGGVAAIFLATPTKLWKFGRKR